MRMEIIFVRTRTILVCEECFVECEECALFDDEVLPVCVEWLLWEEGVFA